MIVRLLAAGFAAGMLAACLPQAPALTPPPPVRTIVSQMETLQAVTPSPSERREPVIVVVPPAQQTSDALTTAIIRNATREAEARVRQTQTGPPATATPPLPPATWTPPAAYERWWEGTPRPSATPTRQPELQPFSVRLPEVLLYLDSNLQPYFRDLSYPDVPPDLVLYGDGTLIKGSRSFSRSSGALTRKLSRGEMCSLLNTVDQLGFYDLGVLSFPSPVRNIGAEQTTLMGRGRSPGLVRADNLDAWLNGIVTDSFRDACQDFGRWGYDPGPNYYCYMPPPQYPPAFIDTYRFLREYDPGGLEPLQPDRLMVWAQRMDQGGELWPLDEPDLRDIYRRARSGSNGEGGWGFFTTGDPELVEALWKIDTGAYRQGELILLLYMRPLWPNEERQGGFNLPELVNPRLNAPVLECSPQDGTVSWSGR